MRIPLILFVLWLAWPIGAAIADSYGKPRLDIVAQLKERPGNIAVAKDGRIFIGMHPFDNPLYKVMEVLPDGTLKPYPNDVWSKEPGANGMGLSNVIHVAVVGDTLYIMDMGSAYATPKLVAWDIKANALKRIWYMPMHVVSSQSYMQDFVVTPDENAAFIADMGQADFAGKPDPSIIYLNLMTGEAVRKLVGHISLRPSQKPMRAAGEAMMFTKEGRDLPLFLGLNPITLDPKGVWLYYGPMGQGLIYKIAIKDMMNPTLQGDDLAKRLQTVGNKPPSDGMLIDGMENIFVASVNDGAIGVLNNRGTYSTWVRDPLLVWPDGLAFGPDNGVYVTVNQLNLASIFHRGEEKSVPPYMIVRIMGGRPLESKSSLKR